MSCSSFFCRKGGCTGSCRHELHTASLHIACNLSLYLAQLSAGDRRGRMSLYLQGLHLLPEKEGTHEGLHLLPGKEGVQEGLHLLPGKEGVQGLSPGKHEGSATSRGGGGHATIRREGGFAVCNRGGSQCRNMLFNPGQKRQCLQTTLGKMVSSTSFQLWSRKEICILGRRNFHAKGVWVRSSYLNCPE